MKRTSYKLVFIMTAVLVGGFVALGCQSDGPEFIEGDTRIIEGTLLTDVTSDTDFFAITRSGTVNILATTVDAVNPETAEPIENPILGVSVGRPVPDDETQCQLTFSQALEEGESFSIYYREGLFCISFFRAAGTPTDSVVSYVVTMTGAFS